MIEEYKKQLEQRAEQGIPPQPLNLEQTTALVELLKNPPAAEEDFILHLIRERIPAGVDEAAYIKAAFLADISQSKASSPLINPVEAVELLGTMLGGYNIQPLVDCLDNDSLGERAAKALSQIILIFDAFHDVQEKADKGNKYAKQVLSSWADAQWFTDKPELADKITLTVFKVPGETNTDDLSPAPDAWSRPDIPLHANAMLKMPRDNFTSTPLETISKLKTKGFPLVYVGDVVGTGSSRKSATNSVLWHMGNEIPFIPNKKSGGYCIGNKIAPIFFNTLEDSGALPLEMDVSQLEMGDIIDVYPYKGEVTKHNSDELISSFDRSTSIFFFKIAWTSISVNTPKPSVFKAAITFSSACTILPLKFTDIPYIIFPFIKIYLIITYNHL